MQALLQKLNGIVGSKGVLTGADVHARAAGHWNPEGIRARAIVRPASTEELSRVMAACNAARQRVVPHGGLTGLVHGADTEADDLVISLERMTRIEQVDPTGRTLTVQAGVTLQRAQEAAEQHNLMLPLDLGARGSCTIGGNVSTNAGGTRVVRYGMTRSLVLGLEAVLADGTVLSSMNRMLKNNAGYDLKQLFIGTEGTLGIVTRVVLRLYEQPASENTALVACASLEDVISLLSLTSGALGGQLSAFEVMWNGFYRLVTSPTSGNTAPLGQDHAFYVLLEALGAEPDSDAGRFTEILGDAMDKGLVEDAVIAQSGSERETLWALRDDVDQTMRYGEPFTFDVSLPIPEMQGYTATVRAALARNWPDHHGWIFGHLADGNLHIVVAVGDTEAETRKAVEKIVYEPLETLNGSVSAEHGIGLEKKPWLPLSRSAAELDVMRRLKKALDPQGILNPGKVI